MSHSPANCANATFEDVGFTCTARKREWHILVQKEWGHFVRDPMEVYTQLTEACADLDFPSSSAFWITDEAEYALDKRCCKKSSKIGDSLRPGHLRKLLTVTSAPAFAIQRTHLQLQYLMLLASTTESPPYSKHQLLPGSVSELRCLGAVGEREPGGIREAVHRDLWFPRRPMLSNQPKPSKRLLD